MDDSTTLADLLLLNLHNFEDEVRGIVDKAVKEMSMEKVLKELDTTWTTMEFDHEPHPRTKITMLKTSEELIETLEDNQVINTYYEVIYCKRAIFAVWKFSLIYCLLHRLGNIHTQIY